ncbi:hypothetical protein [Haladaptatus salinisoli]|uniref:hypothetical protein n=1 Tax=Haladaptatus salinisoli TaxID=2884876 RepID=UPI001D09CAA9|nr:hypothetical protein [Haladaptatus salinisoli]
MTEANTNGWASDSTHGNARRRYRIAVLGKSLVSGGIAGLAAFTYSMSGLMTASLDPSFVLGLVALAGAYAHLLAHDLRESIRVGLMGFIFGGLTMVGVWIAPLWILPFASGARDILLPRVAGTAVVAALFVYAAVYLGAYLTTLTVDAYAST